MRPQRMRGQPLRSARVVTDMTRRLPLLALVLLLAGIAAQVAHAQLSRAPRTTPYERYTIQGATGLDDLKVNWRAYPLLPSSLRDRTRNGGAVLRFGPIGSCRFNLSVFGQIVPRREGDDAAAHNAERLPAGRQYVYAHGTRASAAWRVIRVKGSANVRGIWTLPVNLRTTNAFDGSTKPAWLEIRGIANEHTDECHSGGPRYIGDSLARAFGAMSGTAFSVDLPRLQGPPKP